MKLPPLRIDYAGPYSSNRLFEWMMALAMLGIGVVLAFPGDSFERGVLRQLSEIGLTEESAALVLGVMGVGRGIALFANGNLPFYGPLLRYAGSVVGVFTWAYLMSIFLVDGVATGRQSIITPIFLALAVGEVFSVKRAVKDGRFQFRRAA